MDYNDIARYNVLRFLFFSRFHLVGQPFQVMKFFLRLSIAESAFPSVIKPMMALIITITIMVIASVTSFRNMEMIAAPIRM